MQLELCKHRFVRPFECSCQLGDASTTGQEVFLSQDSSSKPGP